jgi:hypothetical protein
MIFDEVHLLFLIRILKNVSDPYGSRSGFGSGSTTLLWITIEKDNHFLSLWRDVINFAA